MTDKKLTQLSAGSAIVDADLFYSAPQAGGQVKQPASALRTYLLGGSGIRTLLTASLNLYIDPAGNDTTGNGSIGNPWQTIQKAFDYVMQNIDMAAYYNVSVNMANGTYTTGSLFGPIPGNSSSVSLICNGAVTLQQVYAYYSFLNLSGSGTFTFTTSASGAAAIYADNVAFIGLDTATFQFTANATDTDHLYAQQGGVLIMSGANTSITGNFNSHMRCATGGTIIRATSTTTFNSSPTVATAFAIANYNASMQLRTTQTFTGTLTGQKYLAEMGGAIDAFGQTLPGTVAGSAGSAGGTTHGFFR